MKYSQHTEDGHNQRRPQTTFVGEGPLFGSGTDSAGFDLAPNMPPSMVETHSRFVLGELLGCGGMGAVYRAHDLDLDRDVAIKVLLNQHLDHAMIKAQFRNEVRIMGMLQHPGIAHIYEWGTTHDQRPFFVMKLVEGETLESIMYQASQQSAGQRAARENLLSVFASVAQAMAYTHSQNVIHLDLKPANIMVGPYGGVHVMDWGLAKLICVDPALPRPHYALTMDKPEEPQKRTNRIHGTISYMAPEQARGEVVDKRTDVFCLGAILCEILTGLPPYVGESQFDMLQEAKRGNLEDAWSRLGECKRDFAEVRLAKRCLQAAKEDRPGGAEEIADELNQWTQTAREQAEADMTRFFELSLDLFCIAGFDGYFHRVNGNFSRVLGYADNVLLARPFIEFVHEADREETIRVMSVLADGLPVIRFQNRYRTADGKLIRFEWTAKSILGENVIYAVARSLDAEP